MTLFTDPGAHFWARAEGRSDDGMLVGYGSLGRSDSLDEKIDGKWHESFASVMKEVSEVKKKEKKAAPIQPITTVTSAPVVKRRGLRSAKYINTGETIDIPNKTPKPLKPPKGTSKDGQSDYGTGTVPKKLRSVKDNFDNI